MTIVLFRRFTLGLVAAFVLAGTALAQSTAIATPIPPTFAILSLVGDQFTVVTRREEVGSHLDQNIRHSYPVDVATFDDIALGEAESVLKTLKPVSPVLRFSIRDARLFELQDALLADAPQSRGLRTELLKLLREHQVTRLVLVTKWRDDARFKVVEGTMGVGKIVGLGFYVDPLTRMQQTATGEETYGFLGPYAYLSVTVADAATLTTIRSVQARESEMNLPVHATGAVRAWDALTPAAKVEALERVLRRAVARATTAALAD